MHKVDGRAMGAAVREVAARSSASSQTRATEPKRPLSTDALDLIAATMTAAFGHKWTSVHGDNFAETSGRIWAIDLAGVPPHALERALTAARALTWPPVLGEFKTMCYGIPALAKVEFERRGHVSEHSRFTLLVGRFIDYSEWRMAGPEQQSRILSRAYESACTHVLGGGALPEYIPASMQLTAEDERPPPPPIMITASEAIAEIKRALNIRDPEPEPPPPAPRSPETCRRCNGTRKDPDPTLHHPGQSMPGECIACYGSGAEARYNRVIHPDGTIEERIP